MSHAQQSAAATEEPTTNVGTEILFENEVVRVWRVRLAAGASTDLHVHLHDHVFVYANPSFVQAQILDEPNPRRQPSDEGFTYYREVGDGGLRPHRLTNVGHTDSTHYLVEMLGPSRSRATQQPQHNGRFIAGAETDV